MTNKLKTVSKPVLILGLLLVVIVVTAILEFTNVTHIFHKNSVVLTSPSTSSASQNTKGELANTQQVANQSSSASNAGAQPGDNKSTPDTSSNLLAPTGNFVSNHHPNLSGSPAPNQMQSTCTTTSGATCQIIFTKDGVSKSLPAQLTDRGGSTYWAWTLQSIGLDAGSWKIEAKATLGSQSKTSTDAMNLEVAP